MEESLSGVGVLDKTVRILGALEAGPLDLTGLSIATRLPRATAHRLAAALCAHRILDRDGSGRFVLGGRLVALGRAAAARPEPSLVERAGPVLERLRDETGESVQLYVRSGDTRVCVAALESLHSLRTIVALGAVLPMDRGSAAKVLGDRPEVRSCGFAESVEERERGVASVSAPVRDSSGEVVAAVSVSGPVERTSRQPGRRYAGAVMAAAAALEAGSAPPKA